MKYEFMIDVYDERAMVYNREFFEMFNGDFDDVGVLSISPAGVGVYVDAESFAEAVEALESFMKDKFSSFTVKEWTLYR